MPSRNRNNGESSLTSISELTEKTYGPVKSLGETIDEAVQPVEQGIVDGLHAFPPPLGDILGAFAEIFFDIINTIISAPLWLVGRPIAKIAHHRADEKDREMNEKIMEDAKKQREKDKEKEKEAEKEKEKEKEAEKEKDKEKEKEKDKLQEGPADSIEESLDAAQTEMHYTDGKTKILKDSPDDVYGAKESEPEMVNFQNTSKKAQEKIEQLHDKIEKGEKLNPAEKKELSKCLGVKMLDNSMRMSRKGAEPGKYEQRLRSGESSCGALVDSMNQIYEDKIENYINQHENDPAFKDMLNDIGGKEFQKFNQEMSKNDPASAQKNAPENALNKQKANEKNQREQQRQQEERMKNGPDMLNSMGLS